MTNPVKVSFIIPENCPKDIELMSIWSQAFHEYHDELNAQQFIAAVNWFKSYIDSEMAEYIEL